MSAISIGMDVSVPLQLFSVVSILHSELLVVQFVLAAYSRSNDIFTLRGR